MRIALCTYSTRPRGGVVHTLALAEALAAVGQEVTVWGVAAEPGARFFRDVAPEVELRLARRAPGPDDVDSRVVASIEALASSIDPGEYDVVHAQDCISANAVPGSVRTVHHLDRFTSPVLAECHERAIVEPSVHVCVSAGVAAELRDGWGIDATVIPNGVDAERFAAAEPWTRRPAGDPLVLTVGGIEPRKGTIELLEAVAQLRERRPEAGLAIAGGETLFDYRDYRRRFDARAGELGLEPAILGPVEDPLLPGLVAACDVFCLASTKEGFGLAAMEALAAARPVVLSDLPVFREVFADTVRYGVDGPTLDRALSDPPDPAAGQALARSHTWDKSARSHLALYEGLPG